MPKYVLHYFDGRGRAEVARILFRLAGIEFTDNRVKDWPESKGLAPLGQLPYLEIDDIKLPQSLAIQRYLAKEANVLGKNNLEQAQADAVVDTCIDGYNAYVDKVIHAANDVRIQWLFVVEKNLLTIGSFRLKYIFIFY
jgi:glutathione S-transferase